MICRQGLFPTQRVQEKSDGFSVLEAAGYVKTISSGCIAILPFGVRVMHNIANAIRAISNVNGFWEASLPILQRYELWKESGRADKYPGLLCETTIGDKKFVINPTQEEAVLDLFRSCGFVYDDLPLRLFHIADRVRNEIRPAFGLVRSRTFTLADFYSIENNENDFEQAAQTLERMMEEIIVWSGIPAQKGIYYPSAMGTTVYSYWVPSISKQCIVSRCNSCNSSFRVKKDMEKCPTCGSVSIEEIGASEIGDVMRSGTNLSDVMKVTPLHKNEPVYVAMMGLGVSRLMQLVAEYHQDDKGLVWESKIAPYKIHIIADSSREQEALLMHSVFEKAGFQPFLDLRKHSIGRRLVDADLIGIPFRALLGKKTKVGNVELTLRETHERMEMRSEDLFNFLTKHI